MKIGIIAVVGVLIVGGAVASMLEPDEPAQPQTNIAGNTNPSGSQSGNQPVSEPAYNPPPSLQPVSPPVSPPVQPQQPQRNPPPDTSNYGVLSGYWLDDKGNQMQVSVSPYGEVEGEFIGGPLTGYGFYGQFSGTILAYLIGTDTQGAIGQGSAQWMDICHVAYPDVDGYGAPNGRMVNFHVNHTTDMRCF